MNEIQRLIHEMCPDGVPMVALGDLFDQKNGYTPSKNEPSYWENGNLPWFRMEDIRENGRILDDSILHITPAGLKKSGLFPANSIIVATSATIGEHALITVDFLCNQRFTCLVPKAQYKDRVDMKFYFYIMFEVDEWCKNHVNQGGFASVDMSGFSSIQIPLPPLPIQQRIVEILDKFTSLVSSLDSEIALNKRLGDIATFKYGYTGVAKDEGEARYVRITDITPDGNLLSSDAKYIETINEDNKMYLLKKGDLLVARIGATFGKTLYFNEDYPSLYASFLIKINFKNDCIDSRYYWQFSKSHYYWSQANKLVGGGAQPQFNANALCDVIVPIPPLPVQLSIVRTLDTFESLLTNLKKERELRQKQYEYYREKLLTFA